MNSMMINKKSVTTVLCAAAVALTGSVASAQSEKEKENDFLTIGDKAPKIDVAHWITGEGPKKFEDDKIYVLEFWATWCGPCKASIPHVTELQQEYKDYDVQVLGISDEPLHTIVNWLNKKDDEGKRWFGKIGYTIASDPDRSTHNAYMKAAGQRGIPTAFVIGRSQHIEWIGHPTNLDKPLGKIARDQWNRKEFKRQYEERIAPQREHMRGQELLSTLIAEENYDEALKIFDKMIERSDSPLNLQYQKFMLLLTQANRPNKAYAFAEKVVDENWDNARVLNSIAWTIVDNENVKQRNFDFALRVAKRAAELTDHWDGAILDTLARVHYEKGNLEKAIEWQKRAVKAGEDTQLEQQLKQTLEQYQSET